MTQQLRILPALVLGMPLLACVPPQPQGEVGAGGETQVYQPAPSSQYPASESYPASSYPAQTYPSGAGASTYGSGQAGTYSSGSAYSGGGYTGGGSGYSSGGSYSGSQGQTYYPPVSAPVSCYDCGTVEQVQVVQSQGKGSGLGAAAGAAAGGLVGAQFGGGSVNTISTIAGVAGGAYAGHQVEKKARSGEEYLIFVRMASGRVNTYKQSDPPSFGAGASVRVLNGRVVAQ
jgi:outer membrane lipoprotein SlyB